MFPALVAGVFWKRANFAGAIAGMATGFLVCIYYMLHTNPMLGGSLDAGATGDGGFRVAAVLPVSPPEEAAP